MTAGERETPNAPHRPAARPSAPAETWLNPKVEVRESPIEGKGLFALEPIDAAEAVVVMGGRVLSDDEFHAAIAKLDKYSAAQIDEGTHILLDTPHPAEYGNHSCDANTWMRDALTTEARRRISPGEEITIDYAVMTADPNWTMSCNCGAPQCRGIVRGDDWRLPDVQHRYQGHFAPFLNRRIQRQREQSDHA